MTSANFDTCLTFVLKFEGGYVDHPRDPGGPTNLGITQATLSGWLGKQASIAEVKALKPATVAPIYLAKYWMPVGGNELPTGVDLAMFDWGVNGGVRKAVRDLQETVDVIADGVIGVQTLDAVSKQSADYLVRAVCAKRLDFYKSLGTWDVFGLGWTRRLNAVEAAALQMGTNVPQADANSEHNVASI